jgi:hypothetical protein
MAKTQYGHLIKSFSFSDEGLGLCRQATEMNGEFLGYDLNIKYGTYWSAGRMGKEPYEPVVCDYDQVMIWMGADTNNLGELGAEVELCLGDEMEKNVFTSSTTALIPKGFPHLPATITEMDKRFIFMTISLAPELKAKPVPSDKEPTEPAVWPAKYESYMSHLAFTRKGAWHYGPRNRDDAGGAITIINGRDFEFNMMYESINKSPYRFGPIPDKPHVHPYDEFLLFMGADCNDLSELGAEVEMYMGKEMEKHIITTPSVAIQPKGHPHCPLIVTKQHKPFIFAVVIPWGHGSAAAKQAARKTAGL